jgi:2-oxoglutarate ferredoxin oxidoreductase subunit delta
MAILGLRRPLDLDKYPIPRGQVYTIPNRCKGCNFCIEFCPEDVLAESPNTNAKGYHYPMVAEGKEEACVNCGFCRLICPDFAIYTEEIGRKEVSS